MRVTGFVKVLSSSRLIRSAGVTRMISEISSHFHESGNGASEHRYSIKLSGELVKTHAAAGSGGDEDGGNFNFQNSTFKEEARERNAGFDE